jgi:hypothetical protein
VHQRVKGEEEDDKNERERLWGEELYMHNMVVTIYVGVLSESNYALLPVNVF